MTEAVGYSVVGIPRRPLAADVIVVAVERTHWDAMYTADMLALHSTAVDVFIAFCPRGTQPGDRLRPGYSASEGVTLAYRVHRRRT